jgi:hypothetical protein
MVTTAVWEEVAMLIRWSVRVRLFFCDRHRSTSVTEAVMLYSSRMTGFRVTIASEMSASPNRPGSSSVGCPRSVLTSGVERQDVDDS